MNEYGLKKVDDLSLNSAGELGYNTPSICCGSLGNIPLRQSITVLISTMLSILFKEFIALDIAFVLNAVIYDCFIKR